MPYDSQPRLVPVIIMVGPPGSGKSKIARLAAQTSDLLLIDIDRIRRELNRGQFNTAFTARAWAVAYARIEEAIRYGQGVVVDATNVDPRNRHRLVKACRATTAGGKCYIEAWVMQTSLEECLRHNTEKGLPVPVDVIHSLWDRIQQHPVDPQREGFDHVEMKEPLI